MCGRYALPQTFDEIAAYFAASDPNFGRWNWEGHFNVSPTMTVPVIALNGKAVPTLVPMRWGLHPHWKKTMPEGRPLFNARVETAAEKPSFRTPFRRRRALVPASAWYEWTRDEGNVDGTKPVVKTPYYIHHPDEAMMAFAGLWDHYHVDEGISLLSFSILTTPSTGPIKHVHHRMPVRLPKHQWQNWLSPQTPAAKVLTHIKSGEDVDYYEVSKVVNSGRSNGPELIIPASFS